MPRPGGVYSKGTGLSMRFVFQSPLLRVPCQEIIQTLPGLPPFTSWCSELLKIATSVSSVCAWMASSRSRPCNAMWAATSTPVASRKSRSFISFGPRRPMTFVADQPPPQAGVAILSPGSEKFWAVVTARAPIRPSFARRLVSCVASQMQPRGKHKSFKDHAIKPPAAKHLAPCQLHLTPSKAFGGLAMADGPQGPVSFLSDGWRKSKPPSASLRCLARAVFSAGESTQVASERSISSRVQDSALLAAPAHSASILPRSTSPK
mmetsp:Transcript_89731/g.249242  ORF Transcript_89731/g.249242 Transcript_89731/m.249242 type:complete len:263 (-) Transcript_89731:282-1070(-)